MVYNQIIWLSICNFHFFFHGTGCIQKNTRSSLDFSAHKSFLIIQTKWYKMAKPNFSEEGISLIYRI